MYHEVNKFDIVGKPRPSGFLKWKKKIEKRKYNVVKNEDKNFQLLMYNSCYSLQTLIKKKLQSLMIMKLKFLF